jgi:CobQ-like glutamine amidotransferase family enzyme
MIRILHLYPELMNLYGDYGNLTIIANRIKKHGIEVRIDKREIQDPIIFEDYDFVYMGSGAEKNQLVALNDLRKYELYLKEYINDNNVVLFTGNAMELLGNSIDDELALGIVDFNTRITDKRYTGDVIVYNETLKETVGFINKSSLIEGGEKFKLFDYVFKDNNLSDNSYEGYRYKNLFGTHIIGPVLVKNPYFADEILKLLLKDQYVDNADKYEMAAYETTLRELRKRK